MHSAYLALASNSQFVERAVTDVSHVSSVRNINQDLRNCLFVTNTYTKGEVNVALREKCQQKDITKRVVVREKLKTQKIIEEGLALLSKANSCTTGDINSIKAFLRDSSRSFTKIRVEKSFAEFEEDYLVERAPNRREMRNALEDDEKNNLLLEYPDDVMMRKHLEESFAKKSTTHFRMNYKRASVDIIVNGALERRVILNKLKSEVHVGLLKKEIYLHGVQTTKKDTYSKIKADILKEEHCQIGLTGTTTDTTLKNLGESFKVLSGIYFDETF
jgi:hypothetical protein